MGQTIENRLVPDPAVSDAEFLYQQRQEAERAEKGYRKPNLDVGKVWVASNALTRMGALAFIRHRSKHQEMAAERFLNLYEARYGVGSPALDPSRVQVDTSPIAHDSGMAGKIDRTEAIRDAMIYLGDDDRDRVIAHTVLCIRCEELADTMPSGQKNQRQVAAVVGAYLKALDRLALHWGYLNRLTM